jgi:hypothetical protein
MNFELGFSARGGNRTHCEPFLFSRSCQNKILVASNVTSGSDPKAGSGPRTNKHARFSSKQRLKKMKASLYSDEEGRERRTKERLEGNLGSLCGASCHVFCRPNQ